MTSREIDERIDAFYRQWDGRPLTAEEIAAEADVPVKYVRNAVAVAYRKIRRQVTPAFMEWVTL